MEERRRHKRIHKTFILTYFVLTDPDKKYEITQLKNISLGGLCFITSKPYEPSVKLGVELKTPYLTDTTHLEGVVLESIEKINDLLYETRVIFEGLTPDAEFLLSKLIEFFIEEQKREKE